ARGPAQCEHQRQPGEHPGQGSGGALGERVGVAARELLPGHYQSSPRGMSPNSASRRMPRPTMVASQSSLSPPPSDSSAPSWSMSSSLMAYRPDHRRL